MSSENRAADPVVEVAGLTKVFRDFWRRPKVRAVDGVELAVERGEIFGLLGPNGSGKSTTLKILLGLLHATSGSVRVLGRSPRDVKVKRDIGYLPEESYLYGYLTPRETLHFYARLFDLDRATCEARSEQLLEMVDLGDVADRRVGEFSKGMARRVGLAQAMINDPCLLILDEPTSGLDPIGCRQMKDLLLALARRGKTIILSSHLLADVEDVCDRIAIMYRGRIRAAGRVDELLQKTDRLTLTLPALSPELVERVVRGILRRTGHEAKVGHPTVDLETFFLEVIEQAHRGAAAERAAAREAGVVADYLRKGGS